ncbi:MAG: glycosyl hydrolase [Planctomycetota bacterium]|nr:glycosyl hydrolase [Planctomycetota bacterium]
MLSKRFPEALSKRLDMLAVDVSGPKEFAQALPQGTFMGAVAMEAATKQRLDITGSVKEGKLAWSVPAGQWKIMLFTCVRDGARELVDYLSPDAVKRFVELTYQAYYAKFPDHFGTTIDSAFYDEPTFHWVQGGRAWTEAFNEKFRQKHGSDPVVYYPALWYDIGPETAAARNALFGFRAELYATGFPKVLNDWCREHRIQLTGHVDQEEIVNPVGLCGDLMKAFKHQDIPAIDEIFGYGRASKAYKIVSSAAYNYDRPLVLTECYGAMNNMPVANFYKEAMDQFAKGINAMVPHAVWYDQAKIIFPPDLSPSSATYGPQLAEYNTYIGRLQRMLQGGRHVADIGVLYPIATLQAGYYFGPGKPYEGGVIPPEADYMEVGERLALGVRRDFTFVHPEVLDEQCTVAGSEIRLENKTNVEQYKVFIIPGSRTIHWSSLRKIKEFYDNGGKVIATTRLPDTSAKFGKDAEVREAVAALFGSDAGKAPGFPRVSASSSWAAGGFDPGNAVDGSLDTRWNAADGAKGGQWLEVDFGAPKTFVKTTVREAFERTRAYRIQSWDGAKWVDCAKGERLGAQKTDTFNPVTASKVRLCMDAIASDSVSIIEFEVCDAEGRNIARPPSAHTVRTNAKGGKAYFAQSPGVAAVKEILDDALPVYDVRFEDDVKVSGGNLSYIHKVVHGRHVYFFANSSDTPVDVPLRLRGTLALELWDPHTGETGRAESAPVTEAGCDVTRIRLRLGPVRSVFFVETPPAAK